MLQSQNIRTLFFSNETFWTQCFSHETFVTQCFSHETFETKCFCREILEHSWFSQKTLEHYSSVTKYWNTMLQSQNIGTLFFSNKRFWTQCFSHETFVTQFPLWNIETQMIQSRNIGTLCFSHETPGGEGWGWPPGLTAGWVGRWRDIEDDRQEEGWRLTAENLWRVQFFMAYLKQDDAWRETSMTREKRAKKDCGDASLK